MPAFALALLLSAQSVDLAFKRATGDELTYNTTVTIEVAGQHIEVSSVLTDKVKVVTQSGYEISQDIRKTVLKVNKQELTQPDVHSDRIYLFDGSVTKITGETVDPVSYRRDISTALILPPKPVNKGESWTFKIDNKWKPGVPSGAGKYSLEEVTDGVAHIVGDFAETGIKRPMKTHLDFWMELASGHVTHKLFKVTNLPLENADTPSVTIMDYKLSK